MQIDIENNTQGNNIRSISRGIYCPTKDSVVPFVGYRPVHNNSSPCSGYALIMPQANATLGK